MVSIIGIHPDGWLEGSCIFDLSFAGDLELTVYLPEIVDHDSRKAVTLLIGTDFVCAELVRGRATTLGPFTVPAGPVRVCLDAATLEPITETDQRPLGLKLVRIVRQGEEVDLSEAAAVGTARQWSGSWPLTAQVLPMADEMVEYA
jgi:hypothetical protein